jgi:hypothetical protein
MVFGEEQPFLAAMSLLAKLAHALDERVGVSGDLAGHLFPLPQAGGE